MDITALNPSLKKLRLQLAQGPASFDQLWQSHAPLWQALAWSEAQARLYLRSLAGMTIFGDDVANSSFQLQGEAAQTASAAGSLADAVFALLSHAGRPMPLSQLLNKMPAGRVLTEPMLRAAVAADSRLSLAGPLVRLV